MGVKILGTGALLHGWRMDLIKKTQILNVATLSQLDIGLKILPKIIIILTV